MQGQAPPPRSLHSAQFQDDPGGSSSHVGTATGFQHSSEDELAESTSDQIVKQARLGRVIDAPVAGALIGRIPSPGDIQLLSSSAELLALRFDRHTCSILSLVDGPNENPWRTVVWPLSLSCPSLYHSLLSMTAFHWSALEPQLRVQGIEHLRKSITCLRRDLGSMRTELSVMTMLSLAFGESWDTHISSGRKHIQAAGILLSKAVAKVPGFDPQTDPWKTALMHSPGSASGLSTASSSEAERGLGDSPQAYRARLRFLCGTWLYLSTLSRPTRLAGLVTDGRTTSDSSGAPGSVHGRGGGGVEEPNPGNPRIRELHLDQFLGRTSGVAAPTISNLWSFVAPNTGCLDPLMGCASTLFPLIDQSSILIQQIRTGMFVTAFKFG